MAQGFLVGFPQRLFDADGAPAALWTVETFTATGTFTTPLITYSDATLLTANGVSVTADASGYFRMFVAADTLLDLRVFNAASPPVQQFTLLSVEPMATYDPAASYDRTGATDSNGTYDDATLIDPTITGDSVSGVVVSKSVTFAETATGTLHVVTIPIPAGATLVDAQVSGGVLWGAGAAVFKLGDTADDDGYVTAMNLKATDLLPGEVFSIAGSTNNWGGRNGAYLVAATGQRGPTTSNFGTRYVAGSNIIGTVTVTTPAVTTGRTYLTVFYSVGQVVAPVVS